MNSTDYLAILSDFASFEQVSLLHFKLINGSVDLGVVCEVINAMPMRPLHWSPTEPTVWSRSMMLRFSKSGAPDLFVTHKPCDVERANDAVLGFLDGSGHGLESLTISQILSEGYVLDLNFKGD